MKKVYFEFAGTLLLATAVVAQVPEPPLPGPGVMFFQGGAAEPRVKISPPSMKDTFFNYVYNDVAFAGKQEVVKNAPYIATAVTESTQVLADGNRIVNKTSRLVARDGDGRTRRELMVGIGTLPAGLPKIVMISDPVSMTNYVLNPDDKTAHFMKAGDLPFTINGQGGQRLEAERKQRVESEQKIEQTITVQAGAFQTASGGESRHFQVNTGGELKHVEFGGEVKHEDLGTQVIEGVPCTGTRETRTIPAGAIGNERPLDTISETWISPDLRVIVLSKHNDPRFGDTTYRLTDLRRGEPDASLFQIPGDYKITGAPETSPPPPLAKE